MTRIETIRTKLTDLQPGEARVIAGNAVRRMGKTYPFPAYVIEARPGLLATLDQALEILAA